MSHAAISSRRCSTTTPQGTENTFIRLDLANPPLHNVSPRTLCAMQFAAIITQQVLDNRKRRQAQLVQPRIQRVEEQPRSQPVQSIAISHGTGFTGFKLIDQTSSLMVGAIDDAKQISSPSAHPGQYHPEQSSRDVGRVYPLDGSRLWNPGCKDQEGTKRIDLTKRNDPNGTGNDGAAAFPAPSAYVCRMPCKRGSSLESRRGGCWLGGLCGHDRADCNIVLQIAGCPLAQMLFSASHASEGSELRCSSLARPSSRIPVYFPLPAVQNEFLGIITRAQDLNSLNLETIALRGSIAKLHANPLLGLHRPRWR
uniref:CCHC-type domain-containing protein n=1 Tax=Mycena chlorophos TaxID=658473 RepID=A0ABQ0LAJ9_MYCCL|nr:predicted protein [Mycena chlorophos]